MTKIKKLTEEDVNPDTLNGQTLAYLGDAVYEVIIRRHLVKGGIVKPQVLQREATHYVSAKAQAYLIECMNSENILNDVEMSIFNKGRNTKTHHKAKNTDSLTYHISTGFEAVFGYLQLTGQQKRIRTLVDFCIEKVEEEINEGK